MEDVACILCGRHSDEIAIHESGFTGRRCRGCGLIYLSPRPSREDIADIYTTDSAHVSAESHISTEYSKRLRARHNLAMISSLSKGGDILELGCAGGHFLDEARNMGFSPYGIEPNLVLAEFVRQELGVPCEESPLREGSFGGKRFDVIYHCDVLSHLFDPVAEFAAMHRALKEGGVLAFETGNLADVGESYLKRIPSFQYPDHLFFFGFHSMSRLLELTGFELMSTYSYSILPQLAASRVFATFKTWLPAADRSSSHAATAAESVGSGVGRSHQSVHWFVPRTLIKHGGEYAKHLLRYRVGRIVPKLGRPQTVLAVARKKKWPA